MTHKIGSVHLRMQRGELKVQAMGRTARGQRYLVDQLSLKAKGPQDPNFQSELLSAVTELFAVPEIPFP